MLSVRQGTCLLITERNYFQLVRFESTVDFAANVIFMSITF